MSGGTKAVPPTATFTSRKKLRASPHSRAQVSLPRRFLRGAVPSLHPRWPPLGWAPVTRTRRLPRRSRRRRNPRRRRSRSGRTPTRWRPTCSPQSRTGAWPGSRNRSAAATRRRPVPGPGTQPGRWLSSAGHGRGEVGPFFRAPERDRVGQVSYSVPIRPSGPGAWAIAAVATYLRKPSTWRVIAAPAAVRTGICRAQMISASPPGRAAPAPARGGRRPARQRLRLPRRAGLSRS